jgi:phage host-nuclease inhibitor protein Gam
MNPFDLTPSYLKFDISKYSKSKKTPQMSVYRPETGTTSPQVKATTTTAPKTVATPKVTSQAPKKTTSKTSEQKYQDDIKKQIEGAYKTQIDFLSGQEQRLQAQLPDYLATISRPFEAQQPLLQQQLQEQQARGLSEQEGIRMQEQQALAGSRRTAEEAGVRAVQQFGGVGGSSAAQAAGELIGREQLRQQGNIQQQRVQGIQNVNDQLRAIQGEYNAQVAGLNLQKEQALSQARLTFQQQLDTIKKERMTAGVTKAQMTIDALGQFAARRQQIEDQVTQQSNNLSLLREQATLNAQNARLQQSITPQGVTTLPFSTQGFFGQGNQSNELSKVLQAGLTAGTLQPFGTSPTGESLFVDKDGKIVDIRGNQYQ